MTTAATLDIDLGSAEGRQLLAAVAQAHGPTLAAGSALAARLFLLRTPWAPGLRFVGAEVDSPPPHRRYHLAGSGLTIEDAFASCLGEAIERLSQIERPGDVVGTGPIATPPGAIMPGVEDRIGARPGLPRDAPVDWVAARRLPNLSPALLPADWCLRRAASGPAADASTPLSTGTAAGKDHDDAALRAILELVERDAAALWWIGGARARPCAIDGATAADAVGTLAVLRQGSAERRSWLLDVTNDLQVPCIAALSVEADGRGLACGLAARLSRPQAARAALIELCQMEAALLLSRHRRAAGAALTDLDRRHLDRAAAIDAERCALLHPLGTPLPEADAGDASLAALVAALAQHAVEIAIVDLARQEYGIPVVHAVAPALQLMPSDVVTSRLRRTIAATGGGGQYTQGVSLL
jgi:ribosomal protein S12 methylthiotransferase accessory factor